MPTFPSSSCHSYGEETVNRPPHTYFQDWLDLQRKQMAMQFTDIPHQVEWSHNDYPRSFGQHLVEKPAGATSLNDSCYSNKGFKKLTKTKWFQAARLLQDAARRSTFDLTPQVIFHSVAIHSPKPSLVQCKLSNWAVVGTRSWENCVGKVYILAKPHSWCQAQIYQQLLT